MPRYHQANNFHYRPSKQRGAALMVMLVILVMGTAAFLTSSLSRVGHQLERDQITSGALARAKEALIAYAMNSENNSSETQPRPGNLPCPDTDAPGASGYGDEQSSCSAGAIGRLPWKSLGIPELVDSDGEPFWYAVSGNFRRRSMNSNSLNSDAPGTLDVYDNDGTTLLTSSTDKAVAVVFAPGKIVGSQQRSTALDKTNASNYFETGPNSRNNATTGGPFIAAVKTDTFNDKLVYIKASQLLPAVEKRVAGELKNILNTYNASWDAFPFAVLFTNPSGATYSGASGTYFGLAPLDALLGGTANQPAWNAVPSINFSDSIPRLYCALSSGSWTNSRWRCCSTDSSCSSTANIAIPQGVTVTITGRLNSVGLGFWKPFDITDNINLQVRARNSSGTSVLATSLLDNVSVSGNLNYSDGSATVTFSGTGKAGGSTLRRIELRDIQSYSSIFPSWFGVNNWNQVMYYATSPGYAPSGGNTCNPLPGTPPCLTVNGNGGGNNKRAVIVMTGSALAGQAAHPNGTLANYLEGENATPADFIYENNTRSSTFNDQVIIVAP